jgi:hypothetical protein
VAFVIFCEIFRSFRFARFFALHRLGLIDPAAAGPLPGTAVTKSEGRSFSTSAFATRRENWGYDLFTRFNYRIGLYSAPVQQKQQIGFIFLVAQRLLQHIQR